MESFEETLKDSDEDYTKKNLCIFSKEIFGEFSKKSLEEVLRTRFSKRTTSKKM